MGDGSDVGIDALVADLRVLLRHGLPAPIPAEPGPLLQLRQVRARASSDALVDLAAAADGQLRQVLRDLGRGELGLSARALFGLEATSRGSTLTFRRQEAARIRERSPDHWRKHLEPVLLEQVARELLARETLFRPRPREVAPYGPPAESDEAPGETTSQLLRQEHDARVASAIYGARASILRIYRLRRSESDDHRVGEAVADALYEFARLFEAINIYMRLLGGEIALGESRISPTSAIQIAGWHPSFTRAERDLLMIALATATAPTRTAFDEVLASSDEGHRLLDRWQELAAQIK